MRVMSAIGTLAEHRLVRCTGLLSGAKRTWPFVLHMSAFDPKRTWVAHCGNRFNDGFSPYRNARLSRYHVSS